MSQFSTSFTIGNRAFEINDQGSISNNLILYYKPATRSLSLPHTPLILFSNLVSHPEIDISPYFTDTLFILLQRISRKKKNSIAIVEKSIINFVYTLVIRFNFSHGYWENRNFIFLKLTFFMGFCPNVYLQIFFFFQNYFNSFYN